jgi:methionyl-tRNA synthetase
MTTTYVTVAIPFVNAAPHLGYAYELVLADVYARSRRAAGDRVRFLGGTDDHSLKNVLAAEAAGAATRTFVDAHAERFAALAGPLDLSFDDFIRTSADPRHRPGVERLWQACRDRGDLYRRAYEGEYCIGCEQFYAPAELVDGRCPEHGTRTERVAEENWFFRLSRYCDHLEDLIGSDRLAVRPEPFRREVLAFLRGGLDDISVSRSVERARGWGIPVPGDPGQVVYVWVDALANYISALGYGRPGSADHRTWWTNADHRVHVVGKGILRFHAVYWPALLASAGEVPPTRIQVHPYLTAGGQKLSKSSGGAVDPVAAVDAYGADALRWWFAREVGAVADTDYTPERLVARANEDLAHALGNVTNRIVTLAHRHGAGRASPDHRSRTGAVPQVDGTAPARGVPAVAGTRRRGDRPSAGLQVEVDAAVSAFDLRGAAARVVDEVTALNRDLEATRPWALARDPDRAAELDRLLDRHLATARAIATAAEPIVPGLAARLLDQLGGADGGPTAALPTPAPAFARLDAP